MDFVYLGAMALLFLAVVGMVLGCEQLGARP